MKKWMKNILLFCMMGCMLVGCGNTDVAYLKQIKKIDKYVTLGQYKGLQVSAVRQEITEEYMDEYINYLLEQFATFEEVEGRPVQNGDLTVIDFAGFMDGEQFEGGTAEGYELEIGSHSFISGFEEGLVGLQVGEKTSLDLSFPDNYGKTELAGKPVVFEVTIQAIKEKKIPELNEELVASFGIENCETPDQLRALLKEEFDEDAEAVYLTDVKNQLVQLVTDNATVTVPAKMEQRHYDKLVKRLTQEATSANSSLDDYLLYYYGITSSDKEAMLRENANLSAKQMLVLKAIAQKENITYTKRDVEDSMEKEAQASGVSIEQFRASNSDTEDYEEYVLSMKVLDYLAGEALVTVRKDFYEE